MAPFEPEGDPKAEHRGRPVLAEKHSTHTWSFPYFLLHWKEEGDASLLHIFTSRFYVENRKPPPCFTYILCYHFQ